MNTMTSWTQFSGYNCAGAHKKFVNSTFDFSINWQKACNSNVPKFGASGQVSSMPNDKAGTTVREGGR